MMSLVITTLDGMKNQNSPDDGRNVSDGGSIEGSIGGEHQTGDSSDVQQHRWLWHQRQWRWRRGHIKVKYR